MSPPITPSHRRAAGPAVWLAILAFWLQALLPAVHHPAGAMSGPFGFGVTGSLCLAQGNAPSAPHDKAPGHHAPPCPICQTFQTIAAGFAPAAATDIPRPRFAGLVSTPIGVDTARPLMPWFRPRARAPPLSN